MAGSLNLFDTVTGAVDAFNKGGFGGADGNTWIPNLNVATNENSMTLAPKGVYDSGYFTGTDIQSYMDDEQSYTPPPPSYASNADMQSYMDDSQSYSSFNPNQQINPAGTSSPDGMMTIPTNYLYPGEAIGIDGVPYRPNAGASTASSGGGGGASSYSAPQAEAAYLSQDLSQRNPSGTQYAPDLSAYNQSSLYNYPGEGVNGYIYGQGLPTEGADYGIWGTPTDVVNPYYEGQFSDPVPAGVADNAINMSPVTTPDGIPDISGPTTFPNFMPIPPRPGDSVADLTYAQQIAAMGLTPQTAPSTLFPSPGDPTQQQQNIFQPEIDRGGVHDTSAYDYGITEEQRRALSDINYNQQEPFDPGRTIDRQFLTYGDGMQMPDMGNNYGVGDKFGSNSIFTSEGQDFYDTVNSGEFEAQQNFDRPPMTPNSPFSIWENNFDLGRPGDPSYQEFVADPSKFTTNQRPDQGVAAQAMADQMMAGLTKEELRDGLFIEPNVSTGKMGIPDIFTQDKTPIEARDASLFDSGFEFDPDNPYAEQGMTDGFLWQDNNGNYHKQWDDMGLVDVIPGMNDPEFLRGDALTESRKQSLAAEQAKQDKIAADANQARAERVQREQEIYAREQMAAREEVIQRNRAEAKAQAEEQARVAADRKAFQDRMAAKAKAKAEAKAAADRKDAARAAQAKEAAKAKAASVARAKAAAAAKAKAKAAADRKDAARRPVYTPKPVVSKPKPVAKPKPKSKTPDYTKTYTRRYGL